MKESLDKRLEVRGALSYFKAKNLPKMEKLYGGMRAAESSHGFQEGECLDLYGRLLKNPEIFDPKEKERLESCISTGYLLNSIRFQKHYTREAVRAMHKSDASHQTLKCLGGYIREVISLEKGIMDSPVLKSRKNRKKRISTQEGRETGKSQMRTFPKICEDIERVLDSYFRGY
jgi:hypothetical protein